VEAAKMKKIRFGVSYYAPPFFCGDIDKMGYIDFEDMNIPDELISDIRIWDSEYQKTFSEENPPNSGFKTKQEVIQHNLRGTVLFERLKDSLGFDMEVVFLPLTYEG
jgi:hypothetical protein